MKINIIDFFFASMVCRVFHFSRAVNGLKKCEKITKNAEFNGDLYKIFLFIFFQNRKTRKLY